MLLLSSCQPDSMNVDDEISVEDKTGPVITESLSSQSGACDWPSSSSLTARLRRLITAYQRSYRQEQLKIEAEAKGDRRRRRCEQASKLKEIARQERQQRYPGVKLFIKALCHTLATYAKFKFTTCTFHAEKCVTTGFPNSPFQLQCEINKKSQGSPKLPSMFFTGGHVGRNATSTAWYQPLVWKG